MDSLDIDSLIKQPEFDTDLFSDFNLNNLNLNNCK